MIIVVLFKVIASRYSRYFKTKIFKKVDFFFNKCSQKSNIEMFPCLQDFVASTPVDTKE